MVKESDVPNQLTEFQKYSLMPAVQLTIDNGFIILDRRLRLWRVPRLTLRRWSTSLIQILVPTLPKTLCSCWTLVQTTSFFPLLVGKLMARDGTTDFTRTIHYGLPTDLEREIYTRLLKGILAIEATSFPEGTTGIPPR